MTTDQRRVQSVECLAVEKTQAPKQRIYRLSVMWSDGAKIDYQIPHSSLVDLKTRLKNECFGGRSDITIPDLPGPGKRLDIVAAVKRDDRRRRAIDEFFQNIIKLLDTPEKRRVLTELFVSTTQTTTNNNSKENFCFYADVNKPTKSSSKQPVRGDDSDRDALQYADLDFSDTVASNGDRLVRSGTPTLYAEVVTKDASSKTVRVIDVVDGVDDDDDDADPDEHLYLNVPSTSRAYANVVVKKENDDEKKFFRVIETYMPNTSHSEGLAVQAGDIVQAQVVVTGRMFCVLCAKSDNCAIRPMEGWVPTSILSPCQPDFVENCSKGIPVVKSISSPPDLDSTMTGVKPRSSPRPAPRNLPKLTDMTSQSPSCPDSDVDILAAQQDGVNLPIPMMPAMLSPSLDSSPQAFGLFDKKLISSGLKTTSGNCRPGSTAAAAAAAASKQPSAVGCGDVAPSSDCKIRVVAVADYSSTDASVMSFRRGTVADLIYTSDTKWWCIRIGAEHGWVPADFWRIVGDDGDVGGPNGSTSGTNAPWMVGVLSRVDCEKLMVKTGRQRDFVVRESSNLPGQLALSILYDGRVHHFPIVPTSDGKYYIGKHHFSTVYNVILYYAKSTLFVDEAGRVVTLGRPFKMPAAAGR